MSSNAHHFQSYDTATISARSSMKNTNAKILKQRLEKCLHDFVQIDLELLSNSSSLLSEDWNSVQPTNTR
eukprot:2565985-Amphidinium_carterae.1